MSKFTLDWFKTKKDLLDLQIEGQKLENKVLKSLVKDTEELPPKEVKTPYNEPKKLYSNLRLIGDTLTVIFEDGDIISKTCATQEDFTKIKRAMSKDEILAVIGTHEATKERKKEIQKEERVQKLSCGLALLKKYKYFTIKDNSVYLKGIDRTLPPLLVEKFVEIIDSYWGSVDQIEKCLEKNDEFQGLKNFFMWCCLNPRAEVASDLYDFLERNSFRITRQGFFVALRNVVTLTPEGDNKLVQFVSNAYNKVKAVWKQDPNKYIVTESWGSYSLEKSSKKKGIGNLKDLYLDLPNMLENRFTDDWTRTFDIRVGKVVDMPMDKCNWSRANCAAAGLHFTADEINYVGCGDTSVLILINPMKVVGIGTSKGRCYEYLPIMTVPREESTSILHDVDFDTLELDEDYAIRELARLTEIAKAGFTAETTKDKFNLPAISDIQMNNIINSLSKMKATLKKRVSVIK